MIYHLGKHLKDARTYNIFSIIADNRSWLRLNAKIKIEKENHVILSNIIETGHNKKFTL